MHLLLIALSLGGQVVDAHGEQDAVVKVARTGMVHVHVASDAGTACTIADHLRGPFAQSGVAGGASCDTDLLLDAGIYKARLTSPQRGKGKARLEVTPFSDAAPAVKLDDGDHFTARVAPGRQVSAWLHLNERRTVTLEVAGRTAGKVGLWRDGRWLESPPARDDEVEPEPGRPIHHWRIDAVLDPGDTEVVVYGTDAKTWTRGPEDDVVFVTRGAPPGGIARAQPFTIPKWGFVEVAVPEHSLAAFVELDRPAARPFSLGAETVSSSFDRAQGGPSCTITKDTPTSVCAIQNGASLGFTQILTLTGAPGTTGELSWGPFESRAGDGYWPVNSVRTFSLNAGGTSFVTAPAFPLSMDAEPLGCALDEVDGRGDFKRRVAVDAPVVSWTEGFERSFNYTATSTAIWVQIDKPGLYAIQGDDARKASCEVFRVEGWDKRTVGNGEDGKCSLTRALGSGLYEIRFYGGRPGIETLKVAQVGIGQLSGKKTPAKAACSFPDVDLTAGTYRLSTSSEGGATLRGLFARAAPLSLDGSLPVVIDPMRTLPVPLAAGEPVIVHTRAGTRLHCALDGTELPTAGGVCRTGPMRAAGTLTLRADDDMPVLAMVARDVPRAETPPARFDPVLAKLPTLTDRAPLWMDFDRKQSRSMLVQVDEPGLYDLETEGLLATSCRLRTPTVAALVDGSENGRGRNCLVQGYLKPGTYLFTATADGRSRGRAGVSLAMRKPRDLGVVGVGDELFFQVPAGELAMQTLDVRRAEKLDLSSSAQGARALSCRLEDDDGWPLVPVPSPCTTETDLEPGRYRLLALPLTVESRRRTSLLRPPQPVVLEGEKVHALALDRSYEAALGADGKDAFTFRLPADLDVGIVLDHGMQGRLYALDAHGKRGDIVDTVPPFGALASASPPEGSSGWPSDMAPPAGSMTAPEESETDGEADGDGEGGEYGENTEGDGEGIAGLLGTRGTPAARQEAAAALAAATLPHDLPPLQGHVVHLARGAYLLETEHSRGDVGIRYAVQIQVRALTPGVVMNVPVPGRLDVVVPPGDGAIAGGLVRIKTRGDADVRCRLRDGRGQIVAESADSGADWNCAMAVPLAPGRYALTVEAEALQPGTTEVSAATVDAADTGVLKDGDSFKVAAKVASARIEPAGKDLVHDVILSSAQDFSCAVQDDSAHGGALLERQVGVRICRLLLWPGADRHGFRVLVWTADRVASVKAIVRDRSISSLGGGLLSLGRKKKLDADEAGRAHIEVRGRYATGPEAMCREVSAGAGPLAWCRTSASFDAGDVIVAVPGGGRVSLDEEVASLAAPRETKRVLDGHHAAQRQTSKGAALHLARVEAAFGSSASPSCALDGGVSTRDASTCAAATGPVQESTLSAWTRDGASLDAVIERRAAPWPATSAALAAGTSTLSWTGESARFSMPKDGFRVKLALPADAWAVTVDDDGRARDLCAPHRAPVPDKPGALATCVLRGRGGDLVVVSGAGPSPRRDARADLLAISTAEAPHALFGLYETKPAFPGRDRILVGRAQARRVIRVEGWGALACSIQRDDGVHVAGCRAVLPAGQGAEVRVEHDERSFRVFTFDAPGTVALAAGAPSSAGLVAARFGALPQERPAPAALGTAIALAGTVVDRAVELSAPAAVRVRATSGVCAVATATTSSRSGWEIEDSQGLGGGCDLVRVLPRGSHRVVVRSFGSAPLSGNVHVTAEPVAALKEGVNGEALVAAGDARTFSFDLAGDGEVGLGLQAGADTLECTLLDARQDVVGGGCHQFHRLRRGTYYLRVTAPDDEPPRRFKPVVFGLKGDVVDVPDEWLRDFFARVEPTEVHR